tara:strand:- start:1245 stop:1808 length:564 start_codon:yes stop_codon:yes gene_type:complete
MKNLKDPIIDLGHVSEEGERREFNEKDSDFTSKLEPFLQKHAIKLRADFHKVGPHYECKGEFQATADLQCGFCTENFAYPIDEKFHEILAPQWVNKMKASHTPKDLMDSEVEVLAGLEGEQFYLPDFINEMVAFTLPAHPRCKESCKGLCSECGANLNKEECGCSNNKRIGHLGLAALKNIKIDNKH